MIKVASVQPESIGAEIGLEPGSELLSINERQLEDFLDFEYHTADDRFSLLARQPDGQTVEFDIERPEGMPMGVVLEPPRIRRCANRCDFCFVDGLAPGMREVLYIRDDDYRLSFRYGNFATLTNLKDKDIARIIEYRLSPLYVSVHATDPGVRRHLLRNPDAEDVLGQLTHFAQHGIQFHTQVVLTPGINDGAVLEQTLDDLYRMGQPVLSVSVVPVGLTEYSKHSLVREPTDHECRAALDTVRGRAERARRERSITWAHGADELYLRAGVELPPAGEYDGFQQVENGIGAVRYLEQRILEDAHLIGGWTGRRIGVFTGTSMGRLMPQVLEPLERATGASFELHPLKNTVFGGSVTTAGLLPGRAFLEALQQAARLDLALLPAESVNDDGLFIDDVAFEEVAGSIDAPVVLSAHFTDALAPAEAT
ncbi:MAG: DUF512 domain-containing protein [Gemmatimonadales bacterium]|nr:DUF512 domain-containing protein [Gemmatimonadales bacterium]